MATQQVHGIVPGDDSAIHDEPHIEGSGIAVRYIRRRVEDAGLRPEDLAERHDIDLATVYAALTYYHMNPDEMQAIEERRTELAATADEQTTLTPSDTA